MEVNNNLSFGSRIPVLVYNAGKLSGNNEYTKGATSALLRVIKKDNPISKGLLKHVNDLGDTSNIRSIREYPDYYNAQKASTRHLITGEDIYKVFEQDRTMRNGVVDGIVTSAKDIRRFVFNRILRNNEIDAKGSIAVYTTPNPSVIKNGKQVNKQPNIERVVYTAPSGESFEYTVPQKIKKAKKTSTPSVETKPAEVKTAVKTEPKTEIKPKQEEIQDDLFSYAEKNPQPISKPVEPQKPKETKPEQMFLPGFN